MKVVSVIPLKKGVLKGDLMYFTNLSISLGDIVLVPVKNKKVLALVISIDELKEAKSGVKVMHFNLKKITENKGSSIFTEEFLGAVFDTSKYFVQNKSSIFAMLVPNIFIENYDKISKTFLPKKSKTDKLEKTLSVGKKVRSEKLLFQYRIEDRISVYKTLIRESFARGKSLYIVLPTQMDIEKFALHLSRGIEPFTFILHSGISPKKNLAVCEKIMVSSHPVLVLSTPPFLSLPRQDVGTIILEHESSNAYRTIAKPYVDLRTFVEIYAAKIGAKLIMADEVLRYETIGREQSDGLTPIHPLSFRLDFPGEIDVIGRKPSGKKFQILSNSVIDEIKFAVNNKKKVFIFSLRKGLATITACRDCGEIVSCDECDAPLVLYASHNGAKRMFVCNRCEKEIESSVLCKNCKGWNLIPLGIGTDTVYEEIKKLFPRKKIFKLDKESAKSATTAKKIVKEFEDSTDSILIGTEMAFFYLQEKISLAIIASFDSLWSVPNYKMGEKIIRIIISIINKTKEKLIIQTKNDNDNAISAVKSGNILSFVREELEDREKLKYPPFRRFIKITHLGSKEEIIKAKKFLKDIFKGYSPEIYSGYVPQQKNKYVTNALIKIDSLYWSLPEIRINGSIHGDLYQKLSLLPQAFNIFVDPEDLL